MTETDREIVDKIVADIRVYRDRADAFEAAKKAWVARRDKMIEEVMKQVSISKEDAAFRIDKMIADSYPEF